LAKTSSTASSNTCHTGFQYTPVASIATWVTASAASQSPKASNAVVVVANRRTSVRTRWPSAIRTAATTVFLCTSSPAHRGYRTSISDLLSSRPLA
jgi:hypothetical protein